MSTENSRTDSAAGPQQEIPTGAEKPQRPSYAASRSASHRPTLCLHGMHEQLRARTLQLGWVGLNRPR